MKLIVSIGDINGIGLEIFLKAVNQVFSENLNIDFTLSGNKKSINEYISLIKDKLNFNCFVENDIHINNHKIEIKEIDTYSPIYFGKISPIAGKLAGESIELSAKEVLNGNYDAILTLPINKDAFNLANNNFPGHTEFLASICNVDSPLMILCSQGINVALVTIHEAIKNVPNLITTDILNIRFQQFFNSLVQDFAYAAPKIAVLSLNPHAGENGKFGSEELDTIIPAIKNSYLKDHLFGPFPADGFFAHGSYKNYSGVLAMYHDQGLIPLKLLADGGGVNFTANLPIVRTSPDHGTAFEISGQGVADHKSTYEAIILAKEIFMKRKKT